jgi:chromosome segregation ATPase
VDTIAALFSAAAAVASAVAAICSFVLANRLAARAADAECRNLAREIDETARAIQVEARRAAMLFEQIKPLLDSVLALANAFGGSAHAELMAKIETTTARIAEIEEQTRELAIVPSMSKCATDNLAERLPSLRAHLLEVRGILDDALSQRDRLDARVAAQIEERNARDREFRGTLRSAGIPLT